VHTTLGLQEDNDKNTMSAKCQSHSTINHDREKRKLFRYETFFMGFCLFQMETLHTQPITSII